MLPFSHTEFSFVFALYNGVVWPLQWIVEAIGFGMLVLLLRPSRGRDRTNTIVLAAMWLWTGLVYHMGFFSLVNPAAWAFGVCFVIEGLMLVEAALHDRLVFGGARGLRQALGWSLLVYSVALYPALGLLLGKTALNLPAFGLTPCPVTLTTLGLLTLAARPVPWRLYVIPLAWGLVGGSAALLLRVPQDWPLLLAPFALAGLAIAEGRARHARAPAREGSVGRLRSDACGQPDSPPWP
jgi:hypothetical protein